MNQYDSCALILSARTSASKTINLGFAQTSPETVCVPDQRRLIGLRPLGTDRHTCAACIGISRAGPCSVNIGATDLLVKMTRFGIVCTFADVEHDLLRLETNDTPITELDGMLFEVDVASTWLR